MAARCLGCHQDVNGQISSQEKVHGSLAAAGWRGESCAGCHTEHRGATGVLTVLDGSFPHELTGFSLRGHENEEGCADCHGQDLVASFDPTTCASCHDNLDEGFMPQHVATFGRECVPCHDGVDRYGGHFDHDRLAFPLTGRHAGVDCSACHEDAISAEALQETPQECYSCHAEDDVHNGGFGKDCAACHSSEGWEDATFDHSHTAFPLTGSHSGIACARCHVGSDFAAASTDCVSCHPEPGFHKGAFGAESTRCASCHTATSWTPATFAPAHDVFPLDHGGEEQKATCKTCHPATVDAYTCVDCHEHSPERVVADHEGTSLALLEDCIGCHPRGQKGDEDGGGD
jgi:hypothetical protein